MTATRLLVLASSSPYRRALLERLGMAFTSHSPAIDETPAPGEPPAALVERLAKEKAAAVAAKLAKPALVIASDQVAALDDTLLTKPGTHARARAQLEAASGREVTFYTSLRVLDSATGEARTHLDRTRVSFRPLSPAAIEDYLQREQPYDCAGSFKMEGLGIALFSAIHSDDPTALIGLPLIGLTGLLADVGVPVLGAGREAL